MFADKRLSKTWDENENKKEDYASRSPTPPGAGIRRRIYKKMPFKNFYTKMTRQQSVDSPHVLQRRHSTVFPLQVAKAAKEFVFFNFFMKYKNFCRFTITRKKQNIFNIVKKIYKIHFSLFRGRVYKRQMSEATQNKLPQPPLEFFEPSVIPEIPNDFKPMFYIQSNLA